MEGDQVTRGLAERAERDPGDPEVQALIARHHAWIENFYPCSSESTVGWANSTWSTPSSAPRMIATAQGCLTSCRLP